MSKISNVIFLLLLSLWGTLTLTAQNATSTAHSSKEKKVIAIITLQEQQAALRGWGIGFDIANAALAGFTKSGHYEVSLRANWKERYFPVAELGWGLSQQHNEDSQLRYQTSAPYFRLGLDYNLNHKSRSHNRVFVGCRYGFSPFSYDISGPDITDPTWNTSVPFRYNSLAGNSHWAEALFGVEAEIWKFVHLGWSVRYKLRLYEKESPIGQAWYVPGFGRNRESSNWGASFYVLIDINKKNKTKMTNVQPNTTTPPPPQRP